MTSDKGLSDDTREKVIKSRTPLNCPKDSGFERFWKPCMHSLSFLPLTFDCLKVIKPALASDLALKLPETVERHAGSICSTKKQLIDSICTKKKNILESLENFARLVEVEDLAVRIGF